MTFEQAFHLNQYGLPSLQSDLPISASFYQENTPIHNKSEGSMGTESHITISTSASDSSTAASSPTQLNSPTSLNFLSQNYNGINSNDLQACTSAISRPIVFSPTNSILTDDSSPQGFVVFIFNYK